MMLPPKKTVCNAVILIAAKGGRLLSLCPAPIMKKNKAPSEKHGYRGLFP